MSQPMPQPKYRYPVLFMQIEPEDRAYERGFRFWTEDVDGQITWFRTRERADEFIRVHALEPITPARMEEIRRAIKK